jgi:membrane protease YdiL (CAAX protease family)
MNRRIILIIVSGVCLVMYAYLTPPGPLAGIPVQWSFFRDLGAGPPSYFVRFAASALFLGVIPLAMSMGMGFSRTDLGLVGPIQPFFQTPIFNGLLAGAVLIGVIGSFDPALVDFYPYGPEFVYRRPLGHAAAYTILYYLPWEFFFRGVLILPFISERDGYDQAMPGIALAQALPSALIHFGHPLSETLGAVIFGIAAGYLVFRTRSIWPGFVLHATIGIVLDLMIVFQEGLT